MKLSESKEKSIQCNHDGKIKVGNIAKVMINTHLVRNAYYGIVKKVGKVSITLRDCKDCSCYDDSMFD